LEDIAARAAGYGIPGVIVDGNDVLAVHEVAEAAVARARAGEGPSLIECKTYRQRTHTERKEAIDRRPADQVEAWMERDPIKLFAAELIEREVMIEEDWAKMEGEIAQEVLDAVKFAEESPFPDPEEALVDVFAD